MKTIQLNEAGDTSALHYLEQPLPAISANEVLVQVKAISINPVDVKTRAGKGIYGRLKEQLPLILGWDIAGVVVETGDDVTRFKMGDEVFGMVNFPGHGKAYAAYVAAPADQLALKPVGTSFEYAAAATLAALTAWQALTQKMQVKAGDNIFINGASGGVGHFAVQLAKHLGATVTGSSSVANRAFVLSQGADTHFDYRNENLESYAAQMDWVLDTVGGDAIDQLLDVVKPGSTLISIPTGLNEAVQEKARAKGIHGDFMLVQSNGKDMTAIAALLEEGVLKPHVSHVFEWDEMAQAHLQIETGRTVGKVVVTLPEEL